MAVPLVAVVAASNELPESEELDALCDRFLFRKSVLPISDDRILEYLSRPTFTTTSNWSLQSSLAELMKNDRRKLPLHSIDFLGIIDQIRNLSSDIQLDNSIAALLLDVRKYLRDERDPPVYVSDRRLLKITNMLRVVAASCGRGHVSLADCLLLCHCLWYSPEEYGDIKEYVHQRIQAGLGTDGLEYLLYDARRRMLGFMSEMKDVSQEVVGGTDSLSSLRKKMDAERDWFYDVLQVAEQKYRFASVLLYDLKHLAESHIWIAEKDAVRLSQEFLPKVTSTHRVLSRLFDAANLIRLFYDSRLEGEIAGSETVRITADDAKVGKDKESGHCGSTEAIAMAVDTNTVWRSRSELFDSFSSLSLKRFGVFSEIGLDSVDGGAGGSELGDAVKSPVFSAVDLTMPKKVASKLLSPSDYKAWKKAVKDMRSRSIGVGEDAEEDD